MAFDKSKTDYSVYLVTNNEMIPEGLTIYDQVEKSLQNGCTIVQLREKELDTGAFIARALKLHELTKKYNVPLIINDRVDVALAIDAEGVHVGQDDMHCSQVRAMIGPDKILGVSCSNEAETLEVLKNIEAAVDYIGIGPVYDTATKKLSVVPFGTRGIRDCLKILRDNNASHIKSVIIGGLNETNIQRVLYTSSLPNKSTEGVAVVSCIMASSRAGDATKTILNAVKTPGPILNSSGPEVKVNTTKPLVHHITNDVVKNFSANVTIAVGGSPIMSELEEEFAEFLQIPNSSLLLNTGTPTETQIQMYLKAIHLYNLQGSPIVYDPVGCGASTARKLCMNRLLNQSYFSVIKGNAGEILTAAGLDAQMKGVDSGDAGSSEILLKAALKLALEQRCVVVATGKEDLIVNGALNGSSVSIGEIKGPVKLQVFKINGGHDLMDKITGSGCSLGSVIALHVACSPTNAFIQTVRAVTLYKEAGYNAGKLSNGPGSFLVNFVDQLYQLTNENSSLSNTSTISLAYEV